MKEVLGNFKGYFPSGEEFINDLYSFSNIHLKYNLKFENYSR